MSFFQIGPDGSADFAGAVGRNLGIETFAGPPLNSANKRIYWDSTLNALGVYLAGVWRYTSTATGVNTGVTSFNTRTGDILLTSGDVISALTFAPYSALNPAGYQTAAQLTAAIAAIPPPNLSAYQTAAQVSSAITAAAPNLSGYATTASLSAAIAAIPPVSNANVLSAIGYTPYNAANPSGYQTAANVTTAIGAIPAPSNASITGQALTGLSTTAGTPTATDTILSAIGKIVGTLGSGFNALTQVLTGFVAGPGAQTVTATDTILAAFQKLAGNSTLLAPLASPTFTGTPSAPTATTGTSTTQIATTAYVAGNYATINTPSFVGRANMQNFNVAGNYTADANFSTPPGYGWFMLINITANRTFTLPTSNAGQIMFMANFNATAFTWTSTGPLIQDSRGNTVTVLPMGCYTLMANSGGWVMLGPGNGRQRTVGAATFAATFVPKFTQYDTLSLTLTANCTISVPTGMQAGDSVMLLINSGTGPFTVTWSGYKASGGIATLPAQTATANATDVYKITTYDGTTYIVSKSDSNVQ